MAEQITHDVVKEAQSVGGPSPIDDTASSTNNSAGNGEAPSGPDSHDHKPFDANFTTSTIPVDNAADATSLSEKVGGGAANVSANARHSYE